MSEREDEVTPPPTARPWLKNTVMLVALAGWTAAVTASLLKGSLPDPVLLGVPGGLWLALHPPRPPWSRRSANADEEDEQ